ncbi:MAG: AI-2E family transporter [Methanosarcina flavescens]|jgi:AI-2 transport protein TqsA|uniref:AI-2E family transporter n=1 Tax=Methanosarcina flavescens TaxID=1715806 RepID=A0A660HNP9_9EURY|nr:AI-2E family transporter [Methanosarcina flavescens]AYK13842.1 AI-2E family transporter [Methanosarcina flavescens]NLK31931.1 AI-2E family transporter [Methanosarcina flavescens]
MNTDKTSMDNYPLPARILLYSTAVVILTIGMREISGILVPVFFSIFAFLIFAPLVNWFERRNVPGTISIGLVIAFFIIIATSTVLLVAGSLLQLSEQIPDYQTQFLNFIQSFEPYMPVSYESSFEEILRDIAIFLLGLTAGILTGALNAGTTISLIIITTTFLLLDAAGALRRIQRRAVTQQILILRVIELGKEIVNYILIRTEINLIAGIGTTILLLIGRIDFAILWGFLTFLFGYIPFLGFILAAFPPVLLALFKYGPLGALIILAGVWLINEFVESVVFPSFAGKSLKLSTSIVFLSLLYWSFVLGPPGALIAVPLTMVVKMILESDDNTLWMAEIMESGESKE